MSIQPPHHPAQTMPRPLARSLFARSSVVLSPLLTAGLTVLFLAATASARANESASAEQLALAQQRAANSFNMLSDRYAEIWSQLSSIDKASIDKAADRAAENAADKARFSARERAWLNEGRWQEQSDCVAAQGGASSALVRTRCEAEVIERHLRQLDQLSLARR